MNKKTIALIDTSNFENYPTGGQLTSIRGFLTYIAREQKDAYEIILIGIIKQDDQANRDQANQVPRTVTIEGVSFPFYPIVVDDNDPNHPQKSLRKAFFLGLLKKAPQFRKLGIDAFYIHAPEAFWPIKIWYVAKPIAVFSHGNFYSLFDQIRFSRYNHPVVKALVNTYLGLTIKAASFIFALDDASIARYTPLNPRVKKVANGIDTKAFARQQPIETQRIKAIYVGRLSENKQIDKLITAIAQLGAPHQLTIIGDGEVYEELVALKDSFKNNDNIIFLGKKTSDELPQLFEEANILMMSSRLEGMPMSILEAYGAGLGVVSTPVGAIPSILKAGVNGYLHDGTVADLKAKTLETLKDIERISENNQQEAKRFDLSVVNKEIIHDIHQLFRNPHRLSHKTKAR